MDDQFLHEQRRAPDPAFAADLRARLRATERAEAPRHGLRAAPVLAIAAGVAMVSALFLFPSVRVSAQALLDLFRVREFAVVQVDGARVQQLRDRKLDPQQLLGGTPEITQDGGPQRRFATMTEAAAAAGFRPASPAILPRGLALDSVFVAGATRARVVVDTKPLRQLMDAFDIKDLEVPAGLDGHEVSVHVSTTVVERFRNDRHAHMALVQTDSPEVSLPPGTDLARLGEIALRLLGLERAEAHRMALAIDWRTTLVVPVIATATTFQQVTVNGSHGLYVETTETPRTGPAGGAGASGPGAAVMWSRNGRMYVLAGNLDRIGMLQAAESVR